MNGRKWLSYGRNGWDPQTNEKFRTYDILSTVANTLVAEVYAKNHIPVILSKE